MVELPAEMGLVAGYLLQGLILRDDMFCRHAGYLPLHVLSFVLGYGSLKARFLRSGLEELVGVERDVGGNGLHALAHHSGFHSRELGQLMGLLKTVRQVQVLVLYLLA